MGRPPVRSSGRWRWLAGLVPIAALAGLAAGPTVADAARPLAQARGSSESGGLVVHLSATAAGPAGRVAVVVSARDPGARGALGYRLSFGDGITTHSTVPQFCIAGTGRVMRAAWHFAHRYAHPGSYLISVTVSANCTAVKTTTVVHLRVG